MSVWILCLIPEKFLFIPDSVYGHHEAAREEIGKGPDHFVDFSLLDAEIDTIVLQLIVDPVSGILQFIACLELPENDLPILHKIIGDDLRIANPVPIVIL